MLYDFLKIFHIVSAALLLTSLGYCAYLWHQRASLSLQSIQTQTWIAILPFAFFQLITGFTMISLKQINLADHWVKGSIIAFVILMGSWFSFIYFLLATNPNRRWQGFMLFFCLLAILSMIFLMSNKI